MTRDELVAHVGGEIVGGNVVAKNICYGRTTEGMFVLTPEGEAAIMAPPINAVKKPKRAPKKAAKPAGEGDAPGDDLGDEDLGDEDLGLE